MMAATLGTQQREGTLRDAMTMLSRVAIDDDVE